MQRLQRGDTVVVISGKYKGKQGRIKKVLTGDDKLAVTVYSPAGIILPPA